MKVEQWRALGELQSVGDRSIFTIDSGPGSSDKPCLLLLHGFPTSSYDWARIWLDITARFRCIAFDFLGFGFSDKPLPHTYSIHEQADIAEALLDRLGIERYHVLAHDYGDTVAQELLARDNDRDETHRRWLSVCFLNGGLFPETHQARLIQKLLASPIGPTLSRALGRRSFHRSFRAVFGPTTQPSVAELDAFWSIIHENDGRHVFASLIGYMRERREHRERWVGALTQAHCPVQILNGSLDPVSGQHMVERYRQVVGHGDIVELADIGHYPQVEAPHRVTRAWLGWLDQLGIGANNASADAQPDFDVLIQGALVFDGSGAAPQPSDVAIKDGRVAARARSLDPARAAKVVDARGLWLTPGMLDIHTHFDLEVELAPGLPEAVRHGTTTVVMSNCSLGLAYGNQRDRGGDPIVSCFARVENVPKDVLGKVADRATWNASRDYLTHLDELPLGPNVVAMIPHSMVRIQVMGTDASVTREPTENEIAEMTRLVEQGLDEGYAGFSTDALPFHYLANRPHEKKKIPGQYGSFSELKQLLEPVRRYDRVWQATPPKDDPLDVVRLFSLTSGRLYGDALRTTAVAALDVESNRSLVKMGLSLSFVLNRLLGGKFRLQALAAPFKTWAEGPITPLAEEIEPLRVLNEPNLEDRAAREAIMADPAWQARFLAMWRDGKTGVNLARLKRVLKIETYAIQRTLGDMVVERAPIAAWSGETLQAIFERLERHQRGDATAARSEEERAGFDALPNPIGDDASFVLALLRRYDRDLVWWTTSANADPQGVAERLMHPLLLPGFADSGAHLVNMAFYDNNLRALKIASQSEDPERTVAKMVRRLTREPAEFFGLDVGRIEIGDRADLVLIDPERLAAYDPEKSVQTVYRPELDTEQLVNRPDGVVRSVWLRGVETFDGAELSDRLGKEPLGELLRPINHWG